MKKGDLMSIEGIICIALALLLCGSIYLLITKNDISNSNAMAIAKDAKDLALVTNAHTNDAANNAKDFAATQVDLLNRLSYRVDELEKHPSIPKSITIEVVDKRPKIIQQVAPQAPFVKPLIPTAPSRTPMLDRAGIKKQKQRSQ